jgi:hypothetical protein
MTSVNINTYYQKHNIHHLHKHQNKQTLVRYITQRSQTQETKTNHLYSRNHPHQHTRSTLSSLRVFTLNCTGLAPDSMESLLKDIQAEHPHIIFLTECGGNAMLPRKLSNMGYTSKHDPSRPGILVAFQSSLPLTVVPRFQVKPTLKGRILPVTCIVTDEKGVAQGSMTLVAVYWPTGADFRSYPKDLEVELQEEILKYNEQVMKEIGHELIVSGDFNHTLMSRDRLTYNKHMTPISASRKRWRKVPPLLLFLEAGLSLVPYKNNTKIADKMTCRTENGFTISDAILDYTLVSPGLLGRDLYCVSPSEEVNTNHKALICTVDTPFDGREIHTNQSTSLRWKHVSKEALEDFTKQAGAFFAKNKEKCTKECKQDADKALRDVSSALVKVARSCLGVTRMGVDPRGRRVLYLQRVLNAIMQELAVVECNTVSVLPPLPRYFPRSLTRPRHNWQAWIMQLREAKLKTMGKIVTLTQQRMDRFKKASTHVKLRQVLSPDRARKDLAVIVKEAKPPIIVTESSEIKKLLEKHVFQYFNPLAPPPCRSPEVLPPEYLREMLSRTDELPIWDSFLTPISAEELTSALKKSKPKAPGPLGLPMKLVKLLASQSEAFKEVLLDLMNGLLELRGDSATTKESELLLLRKKQNLATLANLRPITLMPTLSKLLSKLLATRLSNILHGHACLQWCQQGFLAGTRCEVPIAAILEMVHDSFKNNKPLYLMFYDLKGAFDRVDHEAIIMSLRAIGAPAAVLQFFRTYLKDAVTRIRLPNGLSGKVPKTRGTPQGCPLSPYLFVIWLNLHLQSLYDNDSLQLRGYLLDTLDRKQEYRAAAMADDVVHIASDKHTFKAAHRLLLEFCAYFGAELQPKKCKIISVTGSKVSLKIKQGQKTYVVSPLKTGEWLLYLGVPLDHEGMLRLINAQESLCRYRSLVGKNSLTPFQNIRLWLSYIIVSVRWSTRFAKDNKERFKDEQGKILRLLEFKLFRWETARFNIRHAAWALLAGVGIEEDIHIHSARLALDLLNSPSPFALLFQSSHSIVRQMARKWRGPKADKETKSRDTKLRLLIRGRETVAFSPSSPTQRVYVAVSFCRTLKTFKWAAVDFKSQVRKLRLKAYLKTKSLQDAPLKEVVRSIKTGIVDTRSYFKAPTVQHAQLEAIAHTVEHFKEERPNCRPMIQLINKPIDDSVFSKALSLHQLGRSQRVSSLFALMCALHGGSNLLYHQEDPANEEESPCGSKLSLHLATLAEKTQRTPWNLLPLNTNWPVIGMVPVATQSGMYLRRRFDELLYAEWTHKEENSPRHLPDFAELDLDSKYGRDALQFLHKARHSRYIKEIMLISNDMFFGLEEEDMFPRAHICPCQLAQEQWNLETMQEFVDPSFTLCSIQHSKTCSFFIPHSNIGGQMSSAWMEITGLAPTLTVQKLLQELWITRCFPLPPDELLSSFIQNGLDRKLWKRLRASLLSVFMKEYNRYRSAVMNYVIPEPKPKPPPPPPKPKIHKKPSKSKINYYFKQT